MREFHSEDYETLSTGEMRRREERPDLEARLERWGVKPTDFIPGFRITYRELDNVAYMMQGEGWSGLLGLDEAVQVCVRRPSRR